MLRSLPPVVLAVTLLALAPASEGTAAQPGGRIIFWEGAPGRGVDEPGWLAMSPTGGTIQDLPGLLSNEVNPEGPPAWRSDGRSVAFALGLGLSVADAQGEGRRQLAVGPREEHTPGDPDWSPSGGLIAYSSPGQTINYRSEIAVVSPSGGPPRVVARLDGRDLQGPSWAPDGRRLVAGVFGGQQFAGQPPAGLWVVDTIGGSIKQILSGTVAGPAWSPSGETIAYQSGGPFPGNQVWLVGADGAGAHPITPAFPGTINGLVWSPDGQALAVSTETSRGSVRPPVLTIHTVRPDGSGLRVLRRTAGNGVLSDWVSPNLKALRPRKGRTVVAKVLSGQVGVRRPGEPTFRSLVGETSLKVRSVIDARRGRVRISRVTRGGRIRRTVHRSRFKVTKGIARGQAPRPRR